MNEINDRNRETLIIAQEECAEVIQVISKIQRFGISDDNRERLTAEVGDLLCMVDLLIEQNLIEADLTAAIENKRNKLKMWSSIIE
jgi:NTP pyrophosphatase (non-canonical NTP hydrolase)